MANRGYTITWWTYVHRSAKPINIYQWQVSKAKDTCHPPFWTFNGCEEKDFKFGPFLQTSLILLSFSKPKRQHALHFSSFLSVITYRRRRWLPANGGGATFFSGETIHKHQTLNTNSLSFRPENPNPASLSPKSASIDQIDAQQKKHKLKP